MKKNYTLLLILMLPIAMWAQPKAGYYNAAVGKTEAALKTQLSSIISAGYIDKGYDYLYTIYQTSDNLPSGKVWDMYSLKANGTASYYYTHFSDKCGTYTKEGDCYNREHTFCDSWLGKASPQRSDAHHVIPSDGYVNNIRDNEPHGKVLTASWTSSNGSKRGSSDPSTGYSGVVFEPIDEYKGDFARIYFYVATRYENNIASWANNGNANLILQGNKYPAYKDWFYNLMLIWHRQDPVSQKEITRNNAIEVHQKNRNPFIDYPELAEYIWGNKKGQAWSLTSGIDELKIAFSISPNPVESELVIKTDEMDLNYSIYNLSGQLLQENSLGATRSISVNQFDNGMYLLQLKSGNRKSIQKFIVNK